MKRYFLLLLTTSMFLISCESKTTSRDNQNLPESTLNPDANLPFFKGLNPTNLKQDAEENPEKYQHQITISQNDLGYARIRSTSDCFEIKFCEHNLIGKVRPGETLWAFGPIRNAKGSAGFAYEVLVQDDSGKAHHGYISKTVVE